jgi:guanylate kinase
VQQQRLRSRGDPEDHVRRRVELGELEEAEGMKLASRVIVNDDLDRAVEELAQIVEQLRASGHPCSP